MTEVYNGVSAVQENLGGEHRENTSLPPVALTCRVE